MPRWGCFQGTPEEILPGSWFACVWQAVCTDPGSPEGAKGDLGEMCWVTSARRFVLPELLVAGA